MNVSTRSMLVALAAMMLFIAGIFASPSPAANSTAEGQLEIHLRTRAAGDPKAPAPAPDAVGKVAHWDPKHTAIIVCDMWDDHWCKGAARRVGELAGPMNAVLKTARAKGVFIIHAPSTCTKFYEGTPQRKLAQAAPFAKTPKPLETRERWGTAWCWPDDSKEQPIPIDDSDMGCDDDVKCEIKSPWTREIATIEMSDGDAVTDDGQETWNLLTERKIDNVILCGVHLNMCVLGRPFAIRQLVHMGKNVVLMRDMTDTMYNHEKAPKVNHFEGTGLMVAHVERYWCPSILSSDITGDKPFKFKEDPRPLDAPVSKSSRAPAKDLHVGTLDVSKVLFIGNSITLHPPLASIGWTGNWGMAATSADKDYVHLLSAKIAKAAGGEPQVMVLNLADLERQLLKYDVKAGLKDELAARPGVVVIALGENVSALGTDAAKADFAAAFGGLLNELKNHGHPTLFVRSSFWPDAAKDTIMQKACTDAGGIFIDISAFGRDESNAARSERKIEHAGVGAHPGDKGMQAIADAIWAAIEKQSTTKH